MTRLVALAIQVTAIVVACVVISWFVADIWVRTPEIWPPVEYVRFWMQFGNPRNQEEVADIEFISLWVPTFLLLAGVGSAAWVLWTKAKTNQPAQ